MWNDYHQIATFNTQSLPITAAHTEKQKNLNLLRRLLITITHRLKGWQWPCGTPGLNNNQIFTVYCFTNLILRGGYVCEDRRPHDQIVLSFVKGYRHPCQKNGKEIEKEWIWHKSWAVRTLTCHPWPPGTASATSNPPQQLPASSTFSAGTFSPPWSGMHTIHSFSLYSIDRHLFLYIGPGGMNGGHEGKRRLWSKKDLGVDGNPGVLNPCIFTEGKLCYERSDEFQYKGV